MVSHYEKLMVDPWLRFVTKADRLIPLPGHGLHLILPPTYDELHQQVLQMLSSI